MTGQADLGRRREAVDGQSMTFGAGEVLLLYMHLVSGRIGHLEPFRVIALVTLLARLIFDNRVLAHLVRSVRGVLHDLLGAFDRAGFVARMALNLAMLAGRPTI